MSQAPYGPTPTTPPPWPPQAAPARRGASQLLGILGLVLGLLGLGIGTAAWFRAAPKPAATTYSDQQVADAKKAVCDVYAKGMRSIRTAGSKQVDPADWLPVAVNTRLAEVAVGNYLLNTLDSHPSAPSELRDAIFQLAQAYQDMALIQLADGPPLDYKSETTAADEEISKIDQICHQ
jgi:hypothetical protein